MKLYESDEIDRLLEKINFPQGLSFWQAMNVGWWETFNHEKFNHFMFMMDDDIHPYYAYLEAKNINL